MLSSIFDKVTRLSIRFRWVTIAVTVLVMVFGVLAMLQLNLEMTPRVEFPQTVVVAQWPDAESPEALLEAVTKPLEAKLGEVEGVVNVESTTSSGFALVIVRNDFGMNQDLVVADIEAAVAATDLPDTMETPQILNFSLADLPIVVASVSSSELTLAELKALVLEDLQPELAQVEEVARVVISGGQELPDESAAPEETAAETEPEDPGRLPLLIIEGAKASGVEVEYAQDVTPALLGDITGTPDQIMAVLNMFPPELLVYVPAETLALLPVEYMDQLDADLLAELDTLAAEEGGIKQFTLEQVSLMLESGTLAEGILPEPTAVPTPEPTAEPVVEEVVEAPAVELPQVAPVELPSSWIAAAGAAGFELATTADITPEVMGGIIGMAPQLLGDLSADMWRALNPEALAMALQAQMPLSTPSALQEPLLIEQLTLILKTAAGEPVEPVALPAEWTASAAAMGMTLETTADIPAELIGQLATVAPAMLAGLNNEILLALPAEVVAALPAELLAALDSGMQQTLTNAAIYAAQLEAAAVEVAGMPVMPALPSLPLPESWTAGAAAMGMTLATSSDITPEIMGGIAAAAPQLLADLTPELWRAIDPSAVAAALPAVAETMEPALLAQLTAIQLAANGIAAEPLPLPESWVSMAQMAGLTLETTADIPAEAIEQLASLAPQLLGDLTGDLLLALPPEVLSAMPEKFLSSLDEGMQQTIAAINALTAVPEMIVEEGGEPVVEPEAPEVDPARLPDILIQGAKSFGMEIEFAQDLTPEFIRPLAAAGPQAEAMWLMLTPDHLRLLQPEVIALLPMSFLETLDPALLAELDELAAEFGGAGQLALAEAAEAAEASADSPPLSGIWLESAPNGDPSMFQTAGDLINNPFMEGAAGLLNFFPDSPNVENPVDWMSALSPEVLGYLVENDPGFLETISPLILEMMSPETLSFLLEQYPDAFDADLTARLAGVAAGTVKAFVPEASITRTDGNPSVKVTVYKDGDANTVEVVHRVFDLLDEYQADNDGMAADMVFEQATFIEDAIAGVSREGALGAVFAVIVILIFLSGQVGGKYKLSWRATLVTGTSIPLSVLTALLLMRWIPGTVGTWLQNMIDNGAGDAVSFIARLFPTNVTLNIMTLSGLTVAIGRVVDDSIVVLENSYRFIQRGDDPKKAVLEGTKEVAIAIFSATVTTVAVFLPLGLIGGIVGSFFLPFGLTVTYALAASFVVSITVVPALTYMLIRREHIPEERETRMQRWYTPILKWALTHRFATMMIATVIFLSSLFMLSGLPQSFIPQIGEPTINVLVNMPNGTSMAETNQLMLDLERAIEPMHGVDTMQTEIGSGGGMEAMFTGGGVTQNVANMTITVLEQDDLTELTLNIRKEVEAIAGSDNATVSAASQTGFGGFSMVVTSDSLDTLREWNDEIEAAIGAVDIDGDGIADIANVSSNLDGSGPAGGASTIIRVDGRPAISFSGELETDNTLGVTTEAKAAIVALGLPDGTNVTEGFESEAQVQGFQGMVRAIGYSILIVYLVMALTFRSLIHPFTILFSIPFALVGAALALFLTNSVLGISAMIGLMMLVGIVVTNGIVLMELVQQLRRQGQNAYDALIHGGRTRLRPIWMTALAAILALIPLGLSKEAGAIIASELALVVMGGLLVSTLLTLVVVPVVYSLIDDVSQRIRRAK